MDRKISPYQLFAAVFILPYGSAVLFFLTPDAKQDAWLAILIYIIPGILLQLIYIALFKYYPKDTIVTYLPKIFGKYPGTLIGFLYLLYFEYIASRVLRDFTGLISISGMTHTPRIFIGALLIVTVSYGIMTGFETVCRAAEILFPLMMIGLVAAYILLFATQNVLFFTRLQPVLENGLIFDIVKSWRLITFPFGEPIAFAMLYSTVNEPKKIKRVVIWAIIAEGVALSAITVMFIAGLGVDYASDTNFPLLETLRLIRVGGFLDRLDILIVVTLVVAGFMKISIFMYVATLAAGQIYKVKDIRYLSFPFGLITLLVSEFIAKDYPQHVKRGLDFTVKYIHLPTQIVIPVLALIIAWYKNKNSQVTN